MIRKADDRLGSYFSMLLREWAHWCILIRGKSGGQKSSVYMGISTSQLSVGVWVQRRWRSSNAGLSIQAGNLEKHYKYTRRRGGGLLSISKDA